MKKLALSALICSSSAPAGAETITFENDDSVMIVRGRDTGGDAKFEFLADGEGALQCVAVGANGKPVAVESSYRQMGSIRFKDVSVAQVDRVFCRDR